MGGLCSIFGHKWNGCTCSRCGEKKDSGHSWNHCRCQICGKTRDEDHDWDNCRCLKCGKIRDEEHRFSYTSVSDTICEGTCRICGKKIEQEHDEEPQGNCTYKCRRCGFTRTKHDFVPIPGRCAEVCSICKEERDYLKIALDNSESFENRREAFKKLEEASMVPENIKQDCKSGKHMLVLTNQTSQHHRGGTSYTEHTCVACGEVLREMDYGD